MEMLMPDFRTWDMEADPMGFVELARKILIGDQGQQTTEAEQDQAGQDQAGQDQAGEDQTEGEKIAEVDVISLTGEVFMSISSIGNEDGGGK